MRIYKISIVLITFLVVSAQCRAETTPLANFILSRQGSYDIVNQMEGNKNFVQKCFETTTHLICIESKYNPNLASNLLAKQSSLQGLALRIRHNLYVALLSKNKSKNLKNKNEAKAVYLAGVDSGNSNYSLSGIEFQTAYHDGYCQGVASIPLNSSSDALQNKFKEPFFIKQYCSSLYPKAKKLMEAGESAKALITLKELHDLKFANIDAYLLAIQAFFDNHQPEEAKKIAIEILEDFEEKMSSKQAEELGDIFMKLKMEKEAIQSYNISSLKFDETI